MSLISHFSPIHFFHYFNATHEIILLVKSSTRSQHVSLHILQFNVQDLDMHVNMNIRVDMESSFIIMDETPFLWL